MPIVHKTKIYVVNWEDMRVALFANAICSWKGTLICGNPDWNRGINWRWVRVDDRIACKNQRQRSSRMRGRRRALERTRIMAFTSREKFAGRVNVLNICSLSLAGLCLDLAVCETFLRSNEVPRKSGVVVCFINNSRIPAIVKVGMETIACIVTVGKGTVRC